MVFGGVVLAMSVTVAACSSPGSSSSLGGGSSTTRGTSSSTSSSPTSQSTSTTARNKGTVQTTSCTLPITTDSYEGFHIGVPSGWSIFPLDGSIVVSSDPSGTEEEVVRPALLTPGITPSSFFQSSLSALKKEISGDGGTLTVTGETGATLPSASLKLESGGVSLEGQASVEVLPETTAHGSQVVAAVASWAPDSKFAADRSTLTAIGNCYGPSPATLFQIVQSQAFAYAIPVGWKTTQEGQDDIVIADGTKASASYLLTLATPGSGVDSAATLLAWAFPKIGITITKTLGKTTIGTRRPRPERRRARSTSSSLARTADRQCTAWSMSSA